MSQDPPDDGASRLNRSDATDLTAISAPYKVLGDLSDPDGGIGVLGRNTAASGTTRGVEGRVDSPSGYGLYTPDDANVEGLMATTGDWRVTVDGNRALRLGSEAFTAGNVVHGHSANGVFDDARAATIGGGGYFDLETFNGNEVYDDFGTVSGGENNTAGSPDGDRATATHATVGGGLDNSARGDFATVAGGEQNTASGVQATIGGGEGNTASDLDATVGGGSFNTATGPSATVGGGEGNDAHGERSTVAGGLFNRTGKSGTTRGTEATVAGGSANSATGEIATIGGGEENHASGDSSTVGGGAYNDAGARFATIAGGGPSDPANPDATNNVVTDNYGTIGGGGSNQAGDAMSGTTNAIYATVGGGLDNTASGLVASVGGGFSNNASGDHSTIGGGRDHVASDFATTIAGGRGNVASAADATVCGGIGNDARGGEASLVGGQLNEAHGIQSTIGGGRSNRTGKSGTTKGRNATVPGGTDNVAREESSFAAGQEAKAVNVGTFVWADSTGTSFTSSGADQFLVRANGGVGLGTDSPVAQLSVESDVKETGATNLGRHVATIVNTNSNDGGDILGLKKANVTDPSKFTTQTPRSNP